MLTIILIYNNRAVKNKTMKYKNLPIKTILLLFLEKLKIIHYLHKLNKIEKTA